MSPEPLLSLLAVAVVWPKVLAAAPFGSTGQWGRRRLEVLDLPDGTEVEGTTDVGFETWDESVCAWLGRLLDYVAARAVHGSAAESLEEVENAGRRGVGAGWELCWSDRGA